VGKWNRTRGVISD